jgi:hypothetical protein
MFYNLTAVMDLTLFELFGILGQILGGVMLYVCCVNYALKGVKLLFSNGIISGFCSRLCYLCYGILITPVLLASLCIIAVTYPMCMMYKIIIMPGIKQFWTYVDLLIEFTSIVPDLIWTCGVFVISRLSSIEAINKSSLKFSDEQPHSHNKFVIPDNAM